MHNFEIDREKSCFKTNNKEIALIRTHFRRKFCLGKKYAETFRSVNYVITGGGGGPNWQAQCLLKYRFKYTYLSYAWFLVKSISWNAFKNFPNQAQFETLFCMHSTKACCLVENLWYFFSGKNGSTLKTFVHMLRPVEQAHERTI